MSFRRFVALGDSTTEGVGDEPCPDGTERGWADRFAEHLATRDADLLYANLAVRGRRVADLRSEQLPAALALEPDLASVVAGVNDVIRPRCDLDTVFGHLDAIVGALSHAGARVMTATIPERAPFSPGGQLVRGRLSRFNAGVRQVAGDHGALLVDVARDPSAADPGLWSEDRLHLSPEGHARLAGAMAAALLGDPPAEPAAAPGPVREQRLRDEVAWARRYLVPWIGRRLLGRSSGDGRIAKRPELVSAREVRTGASGASVR